MNEKSSGQFWILLILGFFAIDMTIAIIAITMAASDPSFRSIPGFSERSVHWGETQRKQQNILDLGWRMRIVDDPSRRDQLTIEVLDSHGLPVADAKLRADVFHFTRVTEQQSAPLRFVDGNYVGDFEWKRKGLWNVEVAGSSSDGKEIWAQFTMEHMGP